METFYNGLNGPTRMVLDASANGAILSKSYDEAYEILERIATNNYQWSNSRAPMGKKIAGVLEVDALTALSAQVASMSNMLKILSVGSKPPQAPVVTSQAPVSDQGTSSNGGKMQAKATYPPGFQQQQRPPQATQTNYLETLLKEYMAKNDDVIQSQGASLRNLEVQMGQLANEIRTRAQDLNEDKLKRKSEPTSIQKDVEKGDEAGNSKLTNADSGTNPSAFSQQTAAEQSHVKPPPPFPQRFQKKQDDAQFRRFWDVLKQLHINIPLVEALEQMPNYVKFLKDILTKKRMLGEFETIALTEGSSAILKNKIPPKLKDPGSFTIPCAIGGRDIGKALCDLGAIINLMPLSVFKKLGIGGARPTTVTLQLTDRSMAHPEGKIEDVLVQVDKLIFPADFIILDYEADREVPIILGRPFLPTGRTLIDVQKGELTMRVNDQQVTFNVFNAMKFSDEIEECSTVSVIDAIVAEKVNMEICGGDVNGISLEEVEEISDEEEAQVTWVESKQNSSNIGRKFESLGLSEREFKPPKPSIEEPPQLELKPLPSHLKYAYLGTEETLPVII
ncbi:uncharacterized protein LOC131018669 [Salvia miltiorrhiza]|uniref:uncharacterized protein LOC131018669 n=1 Tax=Salvia miltiorrhiza TaxID=226208 RepID=UPI0025ACB573|nr:uncharacterized protein LOC131018669 [Salvia miltiorrhiza]